MRYGRGRVLRVSLFLFLANFTSALAKEPPDKKQTKRSYYGQSGCLIRLRWERLNGHFEENSEKDGFENSEMGFGLECGYQYKRLKLIGGGEFAFGDLYLNHEDDAFGVQLYTWQRSWKSWVGLGIAATKKLEFSSHIGYRWLPETDFRISQLSYVYSEYYDWDLTGISRKHADVFGSAGVLEVGGKISYRPVKPLTISLGALSQSYSLELEAILDDYARERLRIFSSYLEDKISLDSEATILLFVPEVTVCPFDRVCASLSVPFTAVSGNKWIRGASLLFTTPLF